MATICRYLSPLDPNFCYSACCYSRVKLREEEAEKLGLENVVRKWGNIYLKQKPNQACIYLNEQDQCDIYNQRPLTCLSHCLGIPRFSQHIKKVKELRSER